MTDQPDKLEVLTRLVAGLAPQEGFNKTRIPGLQLYRESKPHVPKPRLYDPFIVFVVQGRKRVAVDEAVYEYHAGVLFITLAPVPVECQVIEASKEKPMLAMVLMLDRKRMLNMLMKMDLDAHPVLNDDELNPSGIFTAPLNDRLVDPAVRILNALPCPAESAMDVYAYHQRTKHSLSQYARGPDGLDWDTQPDPFRTYAGSERYTMPLDAREILTAYTDLYHPGRISNAALTLENISALFELSLGLSSWKVYGATRWALRNNPSSGNLHPTEG